MIGYFGKIIFETSDKRILTFTDFKYSAQNRTEKHSVIGSKPITEFIGPELDSVSFTVNLNGSWGVKPRYEIERWLDLVNNGTADMLVIGSKALGRDKWIVTQVGSAWNTIFKGGELYSASIDITLEEYIEVI